jgi:hypothetical protein
VTIHAAPVISTERKLPMPPNSKSLAARLREKRKRAFQEPNEAANEAADPAFFSAAIPPTTTLDKSPQNVQAFHAAQSLGAFDNVLMGDGLDRLDLEVHESTHPLFMYATVY